MFCSCRLNFPSLRFTSSISKKETVYRSLLFLPTLLRLITFVSCSVQQHNIHQNATSTCKMVDSCLLPTAYLAVLDQTTQKEIPRKTLPHGLADLPTYISFTHRDHLSSDVAFLFFYLFLFFSLEPNSACVHTSSAPLVGNLPTHHSTSS